jgi:hypothetical protein
MLVLDLAYHGQVELPPLSTIKLDFPILDHHGLALFESEELFRCLIYDCFAATPFSTLEYRQFRGFCMHHACFPFRE